MRYTPLILVSFLPTVALASNSSLDQLPLKEVNSFTAAFTEGRPALNLRARIEHVDEEGLPRGQANTLNTKLSFASGNYQGFAGLIEFSNTTSYFNNRHNSGLPDEESMRPEIPDPKGSSVTRSFLQYTGVDETLINFGRQFISLDNQRFIGNESFRQTPQTFDAVTFTNTSLVDTELFYGYVTEVNNPFHGNDRAVGQNKARTHLLNATWKPLPFLAGTAFAYLHNNHDLNTDSQNTYGVRLAGDYALNDAISVDYTGDYARQHGRHNNPVRYRNSYYDLMLGAQYATGHSVVDSIRLAVGQEVFGVDKSRGFVSFQTPLASNYDFNGLAGQFISKPMGGLKDTQAKASVRFLQDYEAKLALHQFKTKTLNRRYGHEWDVGVDYRWNENFTVGVSYSNFDAAPNSGMIDVNKFWLTATASI